MPYPAFAPSGRSYDPGDWPVKTYKAQNGSEVRMLYGSARHGMKLSLTYSNIPDVDAAMFLLHYEETLGTYKTFQLNPAAYTRAGAGWNGGTGPVDLPRGVDWRYAEPPRLDSVRPGVSSVMVNLVGVI